MVKINLCHGRFHCSIRVNTRQYPTIKNTLKFRTHIPQKQKPMQSLVGSLIDEVASPGKKWLSFIKVVGLPAIEMCSLHIEIFHSPRRGD